MLKKFVRILGGDPNRRAVEKSTAVVDQINALEPDYEALSDEALRGLSLQFRQRLTEALDGLDDLEQRKKAEQEVLDEILPEAFAAVREASKRTIGLRHYDVQMIGGIALHQGKIAEMKTGEGKTLVATLPMYLNALTGRGVHLITVNDYLARRDARWMAPIYNALGLSVGVLQMAARTENGKKAFIVDLEKESPHEDQDKLRMVDRVEAYAADITYGTNSEFGFDYLRDNMTMRLDERVQRGHYYAIVDEVDNVLIDEARTPLIISGPAHDDTEWYVKMAQVVKRLRPDDYEISERDRNITLTEIGEAHVEELLEMPLRDPDRPEDLTHEQARLVGYLEQALRAQHLFKRNKDYLVQGGKVIIIDEFTGRLMPGRRWSDGLHQAVEAKEGVKVEAENVTYATITIQNYFRMYAKLAGMTGTALTEAEEFDKIYKLEVMAIPTNLEYQALRPESGLIELEAKDEAGYKYNYYTQKDDSDRQPLFWRRKDYPDVIYRTGEAKFRAVIEEILKYHAMGRPLLVGTTSVDLSDRLSTRLRAEPLRRLAQVSLIREAWMRKNNREMDGRQIAELQPMNAPLEQLSQNDLRKLAQAVGISITPEDPENIQALLGIYGLGEESGPRLVSALKAGIPHQVLNARKHTEESQIIAGAGAFGAVTIATNMAGRGVDIKLGGELAEEILASVNRVLRRAGYEDPFDMSLEERRAALLKMHPEDYGIYGGEVEFFLQHLDDMEQVKALGGLHVVGSERHEARRIDNQLRGRAARQGDPGSSRFYLSLEDELMVRFGGQQANDMMSRLKVDDALPIEMGLVSRLVEQSQTRVEGANFDVRKHLLEYDDVLNTQRTKIYEQRNRIFVKDDLNEDVAEMLVTEVNRRVPQSLQDNEGPWKLLAWLDQVQPPILLGSRLFPSYMLRLLVEHVQGNISGSPVPALLQLAGDSIEAEEEHLVKSINELLDQTEDRLDQMLRERQESLDTFIEGLNLDEEDTRSPRELVDELSALLKIQLHITPDQVKLLKRDPVKVLEPLQQQIQNVLVTQAVTRLIGAVERRLEEPLGLDAERLNPEDWPALADAVLEAVHSIFEKRRERLLGPEGQITRELDSTLARLDRQLDESDLANLILRMPQGSRAVFDKKTHRRQWERTTRLTYTYFAARLIEKRDLQEVTADVLEHLQQAQATMQTAWGISEFSNLSNTRPSELNPRVQTGLRLALGEANWTRAVEAPLSALEPEEQANAVQELGRQALTEIFRQLLLSVITELWVEYLTQMEALRVSIGLEAYGQRDPLVQYKSKAFELFQTLLNNMRTGVVSRMFTYRPRMSVIRSVEGEVMEASEAEMPAGEEMPENGDETSDEDTFESSEVPESVMAEAKSGPAQAPHQKMSKSKKRRRGRK